MPEMWFNDDSQKTPPEGEEKWKCQLLRLTNQALLSPRFQFCPFPLISLAEWPPNLDFLRHWFAADMYTELLAKQSEHPLIRINELVDFTPIVAKCQGFRSTKPQGKPEEYTIEQLCRALYVKTHCYDSLRTAENGIRNDFIVRWFVGYSPYDDTLSYSTIQRFEAWVRDNQPDCFLVEINRQIMLSLPQECAGPVIGDTFAVNANAASRLLPSLLRDCCRIILDRLEQLNPNVHIEAVVGLDLDKLLGPKKETPIAFLDAEERNQLAKKTAGEVLRFRSQLDSLTDEFIKFGPIQNEWIYSQIGVIDKILKDEFKIKRDQSGQVTEISLLSDKKKGQYRIASVVDPEATFRVHGKDKINFGYNPNVIATENFIWVIHNKTGAAPDASDLPETLIFFKENYGYYPPKIIYDRAAGSPKIIAAVHDATDGHTRLSVRMIDNSKNATRFTPRDFTLNSEGTILTCPAGVESDRKYRHGTKSGDTFRFTAGMCAGCDYKGDCRDPKANPKGNRTVFINDHHAFGLSAQEYAKTDEFKADMRLRSQVERVIAGLVLHNGARNARYRGTKKVEYQLKMAACVYNVKRWLNILASQKTS